MSFPGLKHLKLKVRNASFSVRRFLFGSEGNVLGQGNFWFFPDKRYNVFRGHCVVRLPSENRRFYWKVVFFGGGRVAWCSFFVYVLSSWNKRLKFWEWNFCSTSWVARLHMQSYALTWNAIEQGQVRWIGRTTQKRWFYSCWVHKNMLICVSCAVIFFQGFTTRLFIYIYISTSTKIISVTSRSGLSCHAVDGFSRFTRMGN